MKQTVKVRVRYLRSMNFSEDSCELEVDGNGGDLVALAKAKWLERVNQGRPKSVEPITAGHIVEWSQDSNVSSKGDKTEWAQNGLF